jgi:hypothetical protein
LDGLRSVENVIHDVKNGSGDIKNGIGNTALIDY